MDSQRCHRNVTTKTQIISVADDIKPVLDVPPSISIQCNTSTNPNATGQATATDNCGGPVTITYADNAVPGSCAGSSTITRTWTARDCSGNTSSNTQTISISDTQAPILTCTSFSVPTPNDVPPSYNFVNVTATDNCTASPTIELTSENYTGLTGGAGFCPTTVVRKYIARDECGNISSECTQTITVIDHSSCEVCQDIVPYFLVNLNGQPNGAWVSPPVVRNGICCSAKGPPPPDVSHSMFIWTIMQ